jgi:hypothetical protein
MPTRLVMLETIRAHASERFAATNDREAVRERHYRFYLGLAQRHGTEQALWGARGKEHLAPLDADIDNLHAALGWAVGQASAERALAMAAALSCYWLMRDRYADAVDWVDEALALPGADAHPALRVRLLCIKGVALWVLGRAVEQPALWAEAEAIARALGDPVVLSRALEWRAFSEPAGPGRRDNAERRADEALQCATTAADDWTIAIAAFAKALAAPTAAELRERVENAASLLDDAGNILRLAELLASAAYEALLVSADRDAKAFADSALQIARELDHPATWMLVHGNFALAALLTGDTDAASHAFREELRLCRELVTPTFACEGLLGLAAVAAVQDDVDRAARLAGAATAHVYGPPPDLIQARLDAAFFKGARARCGVDAWDAAARQGAALSFDAAITYAVEDPRA